MQEQKKEIIRNGYIKLVNQADPSANCRTTKLIQRRYRAYPTNWKQWKVGKDGNPTFAD